MATVLVPALLVGLTACQSTGGPGARPAPGASATGARAAATGIGDTADGWLVFEVPFGSRAVGLDCTVGGERRSWRL
jgi:hypothetical protein